MDRHLVAPGGVGECSYLFQAQSEGKCGHLPNRHLSTTDDRQAEERLRTY